MRWEELLVEAKTTAQRSAMGKHGTARSEVGLGWWKRWAEPRKARMDMSCACLFQSQVMKACNIEIWDDLDILYI